MRMIRRSGRDRRADVVNDPLWLALLLRVCGVHVATCFAKYTGIIPCEL